MASSTTNGLFQPQLFFLNIYVVFLMYINVNFAKFYVKFKRKCTFTMDDIKDSK